MFYNGYFLRLEERSPVPDATLIAHYADATKAARLREKEYIELHEKRRQHLATIKHNLKGITPILRSGS